jgi:hypothetical protein
VPIFSEAQLLSRDNVALARPLAAPIGCFSTSASFFPSVLCPRRNLNIGRATRRAENGMGVRPLLTRSVIFAIVFGSCSETPQPRSPTEPSLDAGIAEAPGVGTTAPSGSGAISTAPGADAEAPDVGALEGGRADIGVPDGERSSAGCGDGICSAREDCLSCAADCDPCAGTFACLATASHLQQVTGHHEDKFNPDSAPGRAFDARDADFVNSQVKWGMIDVQGSSSDTGMCWAGGYVTTGKAWDASWDDHKDLDGPTRNSAAISNRSTQMVVTGLHYFNVHDGARTNDAVSWIVQHNWGEYVRDDCIENDHLHSGLVYDSLFDGCYTGISTRPSSSDNSSNGAGERVELDRVLLRLQAMPYPYKWTEKSGVIGADGKPYTGTGTPYGHGSLFKIESNDIDRNPHFSITNSVFLAQHDVPSSKLDFPPESLIDACANNTIIWLGPGSYPGRLPTTKFPGCVVILTGQQGRDFWREKVADWHARHPDVGANKKPSSPGEIVFPLVF